MFLERTHYVSNMRNHLGQFNSDERGPLPEYIRIKIGLKSKGRLHSEETKQKIREAVLKAGPRLNSPVPKGVRVSPESEFKKGMKSPNKGKHFVSISGSKHWNWQGGITKLYKKIRESLEYKIWRRAVYERDNYTCVLCGIRGSVIEADHIKPFALYPELRFSVDNGRTLCKPCHRNTETWGRRKTVKK